MRPPRSPENLTSTMGLPDRRHEQYVNRQLRRHILTQRRILSSSSLPNYNSLNRATYQMNRQRQMYNLQSQLRPTGLSLDSSDQVTFPLRLPSEYCTNSKHIRNYIYGNKDCTDIPSVNHEAPDSYTPGTSPTASHSSHSYKFNRMLRKNILTHRRSTPPNSPPTGSTALSGLQSRLCSSRSEYFRTRIVHSKPRTSTNVFYDLGNPNQACDHCGAVVWQHERTNKSNTRAKPRYSVCCNGGSVQLPLLREPPPFLKYLMESTDRRAVLFRQNMRPYNSMFAFTSIGAKVDNSLNDGTGPYVFRLNGLNYHQIGSLLPLPDRHPRFAQLYFHDTQNELQNRMRALSGGDEAADVDESIVQELIAMFHSYNPLAQAFKAARERFPENMLPHIRLRLLSSRSKDPRRYNLPTASEVAAVIIGNEPNLGHGRDIIVENRTLGLQRISDVHPSFLPMQYPLLFPYGEDGFLPGILTRTPRSTSEDDGTISFREFIAFRLHYRPNEWSIIVRAGRLFQQFLVDCMMTLETQRLQWFLGHQGTVRSEVYQQMYDSVVAGDTNASAIGHRIILPASFTGGPRYMIQSYQDALAICRWAGPPDYFITFTCNPRWPEIHRYASLMDHVKPEDMAHVVARVFKLKVERLMQILQEEQLFGQVIAALNVIEFQKRGLPHVHILLFMHPKDKPHTAADIDKFISAEIPSQNDDPELYDIVLDYMIHGPCGPNCITNGKCIRKFPKSFCLETTIDEQGSASYRRRANSKTIVKNGVPINNSWVVPYNSTLLKEFRAHINVEFVNRGRLVKYLFKYLSKGFDRTNAAVEENLIGNSDVRTINEIATYADCRYMSAPEAAYRLMGFDIQYRNPSVERLAFHLENEQQVIFHDNDDLYEVIHNPSVKQTMFTEWMHTNQQYSSARKLTYVEFPTEWVWYSGERQWKRRQRGFKLGRIYYAHPLSGERFYLRMLLNIQKGPRTFNELRTINGVEYKDYKSACRALGLLENDNEWKTAILEAAVSSSASQLRHLFVTLILFSEVADPLRLWNEHWELFTDDIVRQEMLNSENQICNLCPADLQNLVLIEIEKIMNNNNRSLREIPSMPFPNIPPSEKNCNRLLAEEQGYDITKLQKEYQRMFATLNKEQLAAFTAITESVLSSHRKTFFVHGGGGTGKTYLWNTIIAYLRSNGKIVLPVASSGIAALLFPGGRTAHSRFKIPMTTDDTTHCSISKGTHLAELVRKADLIIWDEAPMSHRYDFETLDRSLRDLESYEGNNRNNYLFGGKTVALGGDFRQILPVIIKGKREETVGASITSSYIWDACKVFHLTSNMRLLSQHCNDYVIPHHCNYQEWILQVGEGNVDGIAATTSGEPNWISIPDDLIIQPTTDNIPAVINSVYANLPICHANATYFRERCILTPTNETVDRINDEVLNLFPGVQKEYLSADAISPTSESIAGQNIMYPPEVLHEMNPPGMPNHILRLKLGVPVMLLRNIDQSRGLCNGTRLIITRIESSLLEGQIITGNKIGNKELIPRIVMTSVTSNRLHLSLRRVQYPIKLCFAMTINKSQGQTLNTISLYLPKPVFTHGQLYVALSRTTSRTGIKILMENDDPNLHGRTQNIVYKEIFSKL